MEVGKDGAERAVELKLISERREGRGGNRRNSGMSGA